MAEKPLNLGHKGWSAAAPENTLAAFRAAVSLGADGVEFDVQLSRDDQVVVIHDFAVDKTTDGHGRVRDLTLAELRKLDAGSWFAPTFAGEHIPTLDEVLDIVKAMKLINIELKERSLAGEGLGDKVVWAVQSRGLGPQVVISSFNPLAIRRVKQLNPRLRTGLLYAANLPLPLRRAWLRPIVRPDALHPHHAMITAAYMRWARAHGYAVHTWTVDDPDEMRRLIALGVNSIITNQPDVLQQVLQA
jgi:glycerophosphoryl diester phosphodiesterase